MFFKEITFFYSYFYNGQLNILIYFFKFHSIVQIVKCAPLLNLFIYLKNTIIKFITIHT
ncbi:hypothetical protein AAJ76_9300013149 [Vairimorpha ceranae]|uniref:Uncharacterized protein n=1 Tax=Vairimorpha ceranae TaxID=40302 RepID=A0A0F9WMG2_9MICR|nr:hypothetical protein AAJ76_9300013149 [Vairimorpha ceranae]KKO74258.1 hypothetical protein AAJ76_9300013149 [Vairimorpha ceranae]